MATNSATIKILMDMEDRVSGQMKKAQSSLGNFEKKLKEMEPAFKQMAVVGAAGVAAIGAFTLKAIGDASDLNESINAVNVVFGEGADTILKFGENAAKSVGLAAAEYNSMATITGALLKDTGKPLEEVAGMTNELAIRAADMASVFNTDVSDAMSAINQAIRGETEAIRRYAGDVTDASLQTYLLSLGINKSTTEMTEQEKRLYRVQLIMEQTKVTAGDFANTSDSLANMQRILGAQFENMSATLGQSFLPIAQQVLAALGPIVESFATWVKNNPDLSKWIIIISASLFGLLAIFGTLGLLLSGAVTGFAALAAIFGAISLPILFIIGLLGIIGAAIAYLWVNWDQHVSNMKWAWEGLKSVVQGVIDYIKNIFESFVAWIDEKVSAIIDSVKSALDAIASLPGVSGAVSIGRSVLSNIRDLFRADGGPVAAGRAYIVGERGPEMFVPGQSGNIIPNSNMTAAGGGGIQVIITGNSFMGKEGIAREIGKEIMRELTLREKLSY